MTCREGPDKHRGIQTIICPECSSEVQYLVIYQWGVPIPELSWVTCPCGQEIYTGGYE